MNKLFTKIAALFLGMTMAVGVGVAVASSGKAAQRADAADEIFYTLNPSTTGNNSYAGNGNATISGITWNVEGNGTTNPWRIGGKSITSVDRAVTSKTAMSSAVTQVDLTVGAASSITVNSLKLIVASDSSFNNQIDEVSESFTANSKITFTPTSPATNWATGAYYKFVFNVTVSGTNNKFVEFSKAEFYRTKSASTKYTVTYDLNGGSGTSDIPEDKNEYSSGATVTVLGIGDVTKTGYSFINWSDGINTYDEDDTFSITSNTTLTAQWYYDDVISAKQASYEIYTAATLNLSNCVTAVGDGALSFTVGTVNYLTYNAETTTITADSTNTGGPLTITAYKGSQSCTFTVSVIARPASGTFTLYTDTLVEGDYVVCSGTNAMKNTVTSSPRIEAETVTINDNSIENPSSSIIWHIAPNGDYWTFYNEEESVYAAFTGTDGRGTLVDEITDPACFSVTGTFDFTGKVKTTKYLRFNAGYGFASYGTGTGVTLSLYKLAEAPKVVVSSRMVNGTVSASNDDTAWTISGFKFFVTYEGESETEVTTNTTFSVAEAVPTITASGSMDVTVTPTFKGVTYTEKAAIVSATLTYINPIRAIYDKSSGASVDVYGYYVGFVNGTGPVIMNGEYGIIVYAKTHDVSGYTEGETILHVTGSVSIFAGLYEIGSATITTATGTYTAPAAPQVYTVQGGETKYEQSRLTHVSGVVTVASGDLDGTAGDADITLTFTKNETSVTVFYKKAAQNAADMAELSAAVTSGDEVTIKCFTGWYNAFQVQFVSIIEAAQGYTAEDFAQQLLDLTDAVCSVWDGHSSNKTALNAVWNTLSDDEHYQALPAVEKTAFAGATPDYENDSADVVENAAGRYNMIVKKYSLSNFASRSDTGTAPVTPIGERAITLPTTESSSAVAIIVIISIASLTAIGGYFFLRKRREQN